MIKVGITGGIGSGKSTICTLFSSLGIPVYNSDLRARELMISDFFVVNALKKTFGKEIYLSEGILNKQLLLKLVFESSSARQTINDIVHPAVWRDFDDWTHSYSSISTYVIQESALLFESGNNAKMDAIITVTCPLNERIERIMHRDNCTFEDATNKINSQIPEQEKAEKSDFVIESSQNNLVIENVLNIHNTLIKNIKNEN